MVIGLSGKYCAGKNAAAAVFNELDVPSIDVDKLGHLALEARIDRIEHEFGSGVIIAHDARNSEPASKTVDRRALGAIVFSDSLRLEALERITHPWMVEETKRRIDEFTSQGKAHVVVNAAILQKMGLHSLCDAVVWVDAPLAVRVRRAMNRDQMKFPAVLKRIYTQRTLKPQPLEKYVDIYKVDNRSGMDKLRMKIRDILDQIEQKGSNGR